MWCWRSGIACVAAASVVVALTIVLPAASAETFRIVNVDRAVRIHMRQSASNQSRVIAYIPPKGQLTGTGKCDSKWCEVVFKGRTGWVFRKYLLEVKTAEAPSAPAPAKPAELRDTVPPELQDTMLTLIFTNGEPIAVYAYPSDRHPEAGRIMPDTPQVEDLGTCSRAFCYIRSGSLVGWIREDAIAKQRGGKTEPQAADAGVQTGALPGALNNTVPTASQATGQPGPIEGPGSVEIRTYSLAGLSDDAALAVRDGPSDTAAIIGWIQGNASVEGLRRCVLKWCLVRHDGVSGWVARRHLADEGAAANRRFQVSGVSLWGALDVMDYPGPEAAVVGRIPSYATGIVPIGSCDNTWCHIRYLGIAGWVAGKFLAQQGR
jgi:SH3-like domain-containing protein